MYILRPIDAINKKFIKSGKTTNFNNRQCTVKKLKEIIFKCDKLIQKEYKSLNNFFDEYNINNDEELCLDLIIDQDGGKYIFPFENSY